LGDRSGKLDPGRACAHQYESHLAGAFLFVIGRFRQFERTQDLRSDRFCVAEAFEPWGEPRELVMTEIAWTHSGSDHQEVVLEFSTADPRASDLNSAGSEVDAFDLGQQHAEVLLFRFQLPDRRSYLRWRQDGGGDLIKQRLKDMMIAPVDQCDLDVGSLERACRSHAGESAADNQDPFLTRDRLCYGRLFLLERFG
jgi:hypothetical protein